MPKVIITGHTSGIGLDFYNHFVEKGWEVVGFNRTTGLDNIMIEAMDCDLFINNSYADGKQIDLLNDLFPIVDKIVVSGSVAAFNSDPNLPEYSKHKKELADVVKGLQEFGAKILMLHLSDKGYNDPAALTKIIDLWLDHPHITEVSFDSTGEPNGQ